MSKIRATTVTTFDLKMDDYAYWAEKVSRVIDEAVRKSLAELYAHGQINGPSTSSFTEEVKDGYISEVPVGAGYKYMED